MMDSNCKYNYIVKYMVNAKLLEPMHIGSTDGDKGQVLVNSTTGRPFIQASSLAGAFRSSYEKCCGMKDADTLFGSMADEINTSRIKFSDGQFDAVKMEIRPRVRINKKTGTVDSSSISGTDAVAGHKFEMEAIGAGAKVSFCIYIYGHKDTIESDKVNIKEVFNTINSKDVQLGGQKSNGFGYVEIENVKICDFDMCKNEQRALWRDEDALSDDWYKPVVLKKDEASKAKAYRIVVKGKVESALLVKGMIVDAQGKDAPDVQNIRNAKGDFIIPGSTIKGVIRSRMEKIAGYKKWTGVIEDTFGNRDDKKVGNIRFFDTVVGDMECNEAAEVSHRIHIDKFTGGVMSGALFSEKNVAGNLVISIDILKDNSDCEKAKKTCGLLLFALRDLAEGMYGFGSGYSIGKGFIDVEEISVTRCQDNQTARISYWKRLECGRASVADETEIIKEVLGALEKVKRLGEA